MTTYLDNDSRIPTFDVCANIINCIHTVWQAIGGEFPEDIPNEDAIEMCLDADRIQTFNDDMGIIAHNELLDLYQQYGYSDVQIKIAFLISLN